MKKIVSCFLIVLICMSFSVVVSYAASEQTPEMHITQTEAKAGDDVTVEISIKNNPGISMLKICIGYDSTVLSISEKAVNTGLISGLFEQSQTTEKNPYIFVWINTSDSYDDGVIATMKFSVTETAPTCTSPITLQITDAYNSDEESIVFDIFEGSVDISGTGNSTEKNDDASDTDTNVTLQDQTYRKGSNSSVVFDLRGADSIKIFAVDGASVSSNVYLIKGDSSVEILPSYLDTLSKGKHKMAFIFNDGSNVSAVLDVVEETSSRLYEIVAVASVSAAVVICAAVVVVLTRKRKKSAD